MTDVIDALKRLERVGSETSKTTEKLLAAAAELSARIIKQFPVGICEYVDLDPNSIHTTEPGGSDDILIPDDSDEMPIRGTRFHNYRIAEGRLLLDPAPEESSIAMVNANRVNALVFSRDVANGLLDALARIAAKRQEENKAGLNVLEDALKKK